MKAGALLLLLLFAGGPITTEDEAGQAETDVTVLGGKAPAMLQSFLEKKAKAAAARPIPSTREAFERQRPAQKKQLMRCLGLDPLPDRTPLNARVTGVIQGDGYRVEKIVFESRPRFPVTAHLYLPLAAVEHPLPVIVNPHGHWRDKKMEPRVQKRAIAQARAGYVVLVGDSPGESFERDALIERRWAGSHFDFALIQGATNATTVYVWDLMRGLDYLATRPEADLSRVGLTGASGGGLATLYAFAADERFTCAVPVCYATSMEVNPHNGCACNHVPGVLQVGDRSDVLAIRAPAPLFVIGASNDPEFPADGTRRTGEKIEKIWSLFNARHNARWQIFESGHDYNRAMREAALGFFNKHLKGVGVGEPVPEGEIATASVDAREYLCLPEPPDRLLTMAQIAAAQSCSEGELFFDAVVALNGGLPDGEIDPSKIVRSPLEESGEALCFESEPGLTIPGIVRLPPGETLGAVVLISDGGKHDAMRSMPVDALLAAGIECLAIDVRGTGEFEKIDGRLMAYLGTAVPFAQGWDVARAAAILKRHVPVVGAHVPVVGVIGRGPCAAQAALYAALIDPEISFVAGLSGIGGWADCFSGGAGAIVVQPRGFYAPSIECLKTSVKAHAVWTSGTEEDPDLITLLRSAMDEKYAFQKDEESH